MEVPRLAGDRVTLRPWRPQDAAWYVAARDDAVFAFTTERRDLTVADVAAAIDGARESDDAAAFAIDDEHGALVGNLALDLEDGAAEISYFLAPAGRGRGLATDAVRTALRWLPTLATERGITRARAVTAVGNEASAALLVRLGFRKDDDVEHQRLGPATRWSLDLAPLPTSR